MNTKIKTCKIKTSKIWQTLILQNCLPLGKQARFTSKNVAQYLLGSRNDYDLFKFTEIKHLLLKFTPLIEILFKSKLVLQAKIGTSRKVRYGKPTPPKDPDRYQEWYERMKNVKIAKHNKISHYYPVVNKRPIKILFASINPMYAKIINDAATSCQMTAHTNRWLCGSITANSKPLNQRLWLKHELTNFKGKTTFQRQFDKTFSENKEAKEQRYLWHNLNTMSRPALAIIPDIKNNDMILREAVVKMIPVVGLVNSDEATRITYPIFGNSDSAQVVHFFCSFLAVLLSKAFIQQKYKQASHRLFHRTRAYLNIHTKITDHSSIKTYSKKYIRANTKLFATSKRGFLKPRLIPKFYRKNSTIRKISHSVHVYKKKKQSVGQKPYWKNLYFMLRTLKISASKKKSKKRLKQRIHKQDIATMFHTKKQLKNEFFKKHVMNYLLKKYTKQFNKSKNIKNLYIMQLKKVNKVSDELKNIKTLQIMNTESSGRYYKVKLNKKQKKLRWLRRKKNTRKFFMKAFGHQLVARKQMRKSLQYKFTNPWVSTASEKFKLTDRFGKALSIKEDITLVTSYDNDRNYLDPLPHTTHKFLSLFAFINYYKYVLCNPNVSNSQRIINKKLLKIIKLIDEDLHKKKAQLLAPVKYDAKTQLRFWKNKFRNKNFLTPMLKKYPFVTLLTKNKFDYSFKGTALAKNTIQILLSEWNNYKKNPYTFAFNNYKRQKISSNNMLWKNLYFKTWLIKSHKKAFKKIPKNRWVKSKTRFYGKVRRETSNRLFYSRKLIHAFRKTSFPKFLTKLKIANKTVRKKYDKKRFKSIAYKLWHKRKFVLKFRRSHAILPMLARKIMPYRANYRSYKKRQQLKKQRKKKLEFWKKKNTPMIGPVTKNKRSKKGFWQNLKKRRKNEKNEKNENTK